SRRAPRSRGRPGGHGGRPRTSGAGRSDGGGRPRGPHIPGALSGSDGSPRHGGRRDRLRRRLSRLRPTHKGDAMSDQEATIASLAARVRELEDRLAIYDLIASYGPIVDSGSDDAVAQVFREDSVYDSDPSPMEGRPAISAMVRSDGHQGLI